MCEDEPCGIPPGHQPIKVDFLYQDEVAALKASCITGELWEKATALFRFMDKITYGDEKVVKVVMRRTISPPGVGV